MNNNFIISVHIVAFILYFIPIKVFNKGTNLELFSIPIKTLLEKSVSCAPYLS